MIESIETLKSKGHSNSAIATILKVSWNTVNGYVKAVTNHSETEDSNGAKVLIGSKIKSSFYQSIIESKLQQGLTAERIYQDLQIEHQYEIAYDSIQSSLKSLKQQHLKILID